MRRCTAIRFDGFYGFNYQNTDFFLKLEKLKNYFKYYS